MSGKKWWSENDTEKYNSIAVPVFLLNKNAEPEWANEAAQSMVQNEGEALKFGGFSFLQEVSTKFDKKSQNQLVYFSVMLAGTLRNFMAAPVFEKVKLCGMVVTACCDKQPKKDAQPTEETARMIAAFAHQTRAPLSTMFSALAGLSRCNDELCDPDIHEYISKISLQSFRLLRTSANITALQSYEHGISSFAPKRQSLTLFLEQLCRVVSVRMQWRGVQFNFSVPSDDILVSFDADKIAEVLLNLFSNAAKFAGEDGKIMVKLSLSESYAIITVEDNGIGISPKVFPNVFKPYFSHDPKTESICGDGIGLTLCRLIILEHKGLIAISSCEGKGTEVKLFLPLCTEENNSTLTVSDIANDYMSDRFSKMYVILSDVCPPPKL